MIDCDVKKETFKNMRYGHIESRFKTVDTHMSGTEYYNK